MFKFIKNLFRILKNKKKDKHISTINDDDMEITINKNDGTVKIITSKDLSFKDVIEIAQKYLEEM